MNTYRKNADPSLHAHALSPSIIVSTRLVGSIYQRRVSLGQQHDSPLEWRNRLALGLVQSRANNLSVAKLDIRLANVSLEGKSVLHPRVIVTLWVVLTGVGASGLLSGSGGNNGLNGVLHNVSQLEGFDEITEGQ